MSLGMEALDQISQRLQRIEANQSMLATELRRVSSMLLGILGDCPRCRLQLDSTIPPEPQQ